MRRFIASGLLTVLAVATTAACSSDEKSSSTPSTTRPAALKVPTDFPRDEVPLPTAGNIDAVGTDSSDGKQFFTITYVVPGEELSTALAGFTDALRTNGFEVTPTPEAETAGEFSAQGPKWVVVVRAAAAGTGGGDGSYTLQVQRRPGS